MTLGEYRVGISFNPGGNEKVDAIKRTAADFIDLLAKYRADITADDSKTHNETQRLFALAMTDVETAAMYGVKAVTKLEWKA